MTKSEFHNQENQEKKIQKLLKKDKDNPQLLAALGLIKAVQNNHIQALKYLSKAYQLDSSSKDIAYNYAICLQKNFDFKSSYKVTQRLVENYSEIEVQLINLTNLIHLARFEEAETIISILEINYPDNIEIIKNKILCLKNAKNINLLNKYIQEITQNSLINYLNKIEIAELLIALGHSSDAQILYSNCLNTREDYKAILGLAITSGNLNNFKQALNFLDEGLKKGYQTAEIFYYKGLSLKMLGEFKGAELALRNALYQNEFDENIRLNLGMLYNEMVEYEKALDILSPIKKDIKIYINKLITEGDCLYWMGKPEQAIKKFKQAKSLDQKNIDSYVNLGSVYSDLNMNDQAVAEYESALKINPNYPAAKHNIGYLNLKKMNFKEGWDGYEYRFQIKENLLNYRQINLPLWTPDQINKNVLIWSEQGIGDQILFSTIFESLDTEKNRFTILISKKLKDIFQRSYPSLIFVEEMPLHSIYDCHLPLGTLGKYFRPNIESFKNSKNKRLKTSEKFDDIFSKVLPKNKLKIGISNLSSNKKIGKIKSFDFFDLISHLDLENSVFIKLQNEDLDYVEQNSKYKEMVDRIFTFRQFDLFNDIDCLASLVGACDLVLSASNSIAHLSGALQKKTCVIAPADAGKLWYWSNHENKKSIWYPTLQIYSQTKIGEWNSIFENLQNYLEEIKKNIID